LYPKISSLENNEPGKHREYTGEYTAEDLNIFRTIQTHLEIGLTYKQIEEQLNVVE